ncbi:MAG: HAD family hydrolase [Candidatus Solibacter usitatus]|nr:HAD family hydrolase [Candidatus Solibacter usitatus]
MIPAFPVYLFDVDGTLLDSAADICGAVRDTFSECGIDGLDESHLRSYIGHHLFDLFEDVIPGVSQEQKDHLLVRYRAIYAARGHSSTRPYDGVAEALARIPGRKSTATTKSTQTVRIILGQFGLLSYFEHVQGTDGFPAKPAPDVIYKSLEALQVRAKDVLLVGDSETDMAAGRAAGVRVCAVQYGYGDIEKMKAFQPDYWIGHLNELC